MLNIVIGNKGLKSARRKGRKYSEGRKGKDEANCPWGNSLKEKLKKLGYENQRDRTVIGKSESWKEIYTRM